MSENIIFDISVLKFIETYFIFWHSIGSVLVNIPDTLEKNDSAVLDSINSHMYYDKSWISRAGKGGKVGNDQLWVTRNVSQSRSHCTGI